LVGIRNGSTGRKIVTNTKLLKSTVFAAAALGVMAFAYSGMLGVFLTALLTKRGNGATVIAALIVGVATTALLQKSVYPVWTEKLTGKPHELAEFWWLPIGATLSFLVCVAGSPRRPPIESAFPVIVARQG